MSHLALAKPAETSPEAEFSRDVRDSIFGQAQGEFSLFVPVHYQTGYSYPLIVWLHSDTADCDEIHRLMPQVSSRNHFAIAPQSVCSHGLAWPDCEEVVEAAYQSVMACVDHAKLRFNISSNRVYIAGSGAGGSMALKLAFQCPDVFAGVVSIDGPMDTEEVPLRDWERCRDLDVLLACFRDSSSYSQDDLCHHLRLLHVAGFSTTVRQYPGRVKLSGKLLSDVNRWILEQIESAIL